MKLIIGSGEHVDFKLILGIATIIFLYFILVKIFKRIQYNLFSVRIYLMLLVVGLFLSSNIEYISPNVSENLVVNNKLSVFIKATLMHFSTKQQQNAVYKISDFQKINENIFASKSELPEFPLFHTLPEKSEFANYFKKNEKGPPNIVILIVESLSTSMVGKRADNTGHLMPFLDSLIPHSLYFPNFLTTCERTHNVLPATLSSVPNAPEGNMMLLMDHPLHWSLMSLLKKEYYSRFYCGVDLSYCNMNGFMNYHHTDYLVKNWENKFRIKEKGEKSAWGYPDQKLFEKSWLDYERQKTQNKPRLDVFLTISTHDPFIIPDQDKYTKIVERKIKSIQNPTKNQSDVLKYARQFSTYSYTDNAIQSYFKEAKKKPDFENTIYIIFGDHGNQFCLYDELEKYKIPLIIYSPLLKKAKQINSVSTQLDIAPTIINYLRTTYKLKLPSQVPFIGKELSYKENFECKRTLPFNSIDMQNKAIVDKNYYLANNQLYHIHKDLKLSLSPNEKEKKRMLEELKLYNKMSSYVYFNERFLPLNYYKAYTSMAIYDEICHYKNIKPSLSERSATYINIGKELPLKKNTETVKINCTIEFYLNSTEQFHKLPLLSYSLENIQKMKNELVLWKQSKPKINQKIIQEGWYKIEYSGVIQLKDFKKLSKNNKLKYYLLNTVNKPYRMRNMNTTIQVNNYNSIRR
ncbi:MAG: LTA synthase family protein [Flavobacteriia bacterium]|nr:LTA synthase family protein [Flavobacteriia bacterium]